MDIFFKDQSGDLKGPFPQSLIQTWYRGKYFLGSFPFCFMPVGDAPTETSEFTTLDRLIARNGVGCPFSPIKTDQDTENLEKRLEKLGKDLDELKEKAEIANALEARLSDCEQRIKNLLDTDKKAADQKKLENSMRSQLQKQQDDALSSYTKEYKESMDRLAAHFTYNDESGKSVALQEEERIAAMESENEEKKSKKKNKEENPKEAKREWMDEVVDFVIAYFDMLKCGDFSRATTLLASGNIALTEQRLVPFAAERARFSAALLEKMEKKEHFFCAVCRMMMITPKQALIHIIGGEHYARAEHECRHADVAPLVHHIIRIAGEAPDRWAHEELAQVAEETRKNGKLTSTKDLFPRPGFMETLMDPFLDEFFPSNSALTPQQLVDTMYPHFKNGFAQQAMTAIHAHIGDGQTFCDLCKVKTGGREEYYAHLMRYDHTKKTAVMHVQTIAVNMMRGRRTK